MPKRSSKLDLNQLAKSIVDQAIGEATKPQEEPAKTLAAIAKSRLGGLKGGVARAKKLTAEERSEIARIAANSRWKKTVLS